MSTLVRPWEPIKELGLTELIGADEQVAQNQFSADETIALGSLMSGEILGVLLEMHAAAAGAVINEVGYLYFFDADPGLSAADTSFSSVANAQKAIGGIAVAVADWSPAAGKYIICTKSVAIPFHVIENLYIAYFHTGATQYNSAGNDNEVLSVNAWVRRES